MAAGKRGRALTHRLIEEHLVEGALEPGGEIALAIDQTLTQDATGTLVMLELEAIGLDRVRTHSVQYVDHNLLAVDHRNPDDHLFLASACKRFGIAYSGPGNGVSHAVHMQRVGRPGLTLLGSDSHTCAGGALGMLAIGVGGLAVAAAMAGRPLHLRMPETWGIELTASLPPWTSAKDVILELLRRHGVSGGVGRILEYHGPGLAGLTAMDRHVIANMGAELGATASVFPADEEVRRFLAEQGREEHFRELAAEPGVSYDHVERVDLSSIEPLVALPSSPGNVVAVREVAGEPVVQAYIGSSANPGYRDFAVAAHMLRGRRVRDGVSFDVNPTSRQTLAELTDDGWLGHLLAAGARLHQTGCNGCIGMGQAPASGRNSLRTTPRNFPGRSGTREDSVFLASPETVAAAALTGRITDPRELAAELGLEPLGDASPRRPRTDVELVVPPERIDLGAAAETDAEGRASLVRGPGIAPLPELDPFPDALELPVLLKLGDDVSTDEILPAGARVLPLRSSIPDIARYCFEPVDESYVERADALPPPGHHAVVAGANYGQGSSREHAALAPRSLGLRVVLAGSFARIHEENLVRFGVLPLRFVNADDAGHVACGERLRLDGVAAALREGRETLEVTTADGGHRFEAGHRLSERQVEVLLAGGFIPWLRDAQPMATSVASPTP